MTVACSLALTLGTALGGWRIIRTVGRRIYRVKPVDGLATQSSSAGVIFGASLLGRADLDQPGRRLGRGRRRRRTRRWHHVHWALVRQMGVAWLITMPISAAPRSGDLRVGAAAELMADDEPDTTGSCPTSPTCSECCGARSTETLAGLDALAAWAAGDASAAAAVREAEHAATRRKREVLERDQHRRS